MIEIQQLADGTVRYLNVQDANADLVLGGQAVPDGGANPRYLSDNVVKLTLQNAGGNGGVAAWQNPFPYAVIIVGTVLDVVTGGGAFTASVGTAANGTTSASNLISSQSISATGVFGTRTTLVKLPVANWVTVTASGTPSGLVGCLYLELFPAT